MTDEPPTTEAIAAALGVDEATLRGCLPQRPEHALVQLAETADLALDDVDADLREDFEAWVRRAAWREFVVETSQSGFLIDVGGRHSERLKLLRCPVCEESFVEAWERRVNDPIGDHLADAHTPEDFRHRPTPRPTPSDVFYTRPPSDAGRDAEGTQKNNRLRQEANTRRPPFRVEPAGNRRRRVLLYRLLDEAPAKSLRSPRSGASTLSGATSSRRRASDTPK